MGQATSRAVLSLAPALALAVATSLGGCKKSFSRGYTNIAALTDSLAYGDSDAKASAVSGAPKCGTDGGEKAPLPCFDEVVAWFGSKNGFKSDPPDQASAATAALVLTRERHGEWLPTPNAWIIALRTGSGEGADALRLAVATRLADAAPPLAHALTSDSDARAVMRTVASSVPGACETYARLGAGDDVAAGPPEKTADHSPCVQKDLERETGPREHGRYGVGVGLWRGAEGALALWRETADALAAGSSRADARIRGALEKKVTEGVAALKNVETKQLPPRGDYAAVMGDEHRDAGIAIPRR